ncbi:MAG: PorT family protein [Bacteroides sp.]|nr:PorT family protein [Bacteroides sp.]
MKKVIFSAVVLLATVCTGVQGQTKTSFGVKLNGTLSNIKLTDAKGVSTNFNPGVATGGFVHIRFTEHLALQPELIVNYTESEVKYRGEKTKFKYGSIEMPVYGMGWYKAGKGQIFVGVGPHIGYGFSADSAVERLSEEVAFKDVIELDHWYAGGGITTGYEWNTGIFVQAGYQLGFDISSKNSGVKTHTISLGVGYRF